MADVIEDTMGEIAKRYGKGDEGKGLDFELILGVWCKNSPKGDADDSDDPPDPIGLYSIFPPGDGERRGVAELVEDYTTLGSGGLFARYLLNRLHEDDRSSLSQMTMTEALHEALYIVSEVNKIDLYCGGEIHAVCIPRAGDRVERVQQERIQKILRALDKADKTIKRTQRDMMKSVTTMVDGAS